MTWSRNWPVEVEQAILDLESSVESAAADWSVNPFAGRPAESPQQHVLVALSYMSNLNLRLAIREYEKVLVKSPDLADPHWGIGISLYSLAALNMLARGRCKISKSEIRFVAGRLDEESYLRREAKIVAQGALTFASVGKAMREQGWQTLELLGAMAVVLGKVSGLIPESRQGVDMARRSLPTELIPLAVFSPDKTARVLLNLALGELIAGYDYPQIKVPPNVLNFYDYEMQSVQGRIQELLRTAAPNVSQAQGYLDQLRVRFDRVRSESGPSFELFAKFRQMALHEGKPDACVQAGAMFLAGAFFTVAEEMFQKALSLLPSSTEGLWGLAQTYYGLALFDLIERGEFEIGWRETNPGLLNDMRRAPLKYDLSAMLHLATVGPLQDVFAPKGLEASQVASFLALLVESQPRFLPHAAPLPVWRPDDKTQLLFRLALDCAERARRGARLPVPTDKPVAFNPADLGAFYTHLQRISGVVAPQTAPPPRAPSIDPLSRAKELYYQRRFEEAAELLDQGLRGGSENAEAWNWLANCQMELEEYESAIHSFDQALRLAPGEPANWNDKGVALRRLYRFAEAIECFQQAHLLSPGDTISTKNIDEARQFEQSLRETAKNLVKGFENFSPAQQASFHRAALAYGRGLKLKEIGQDMQAGRLIEEALKEYRELPRCQSLEWSALQIYCDIAQKTDGFSPGAILAARLRIQHLISVLKLEDETFRSEGTEREAALGVGVAFLGAGRWEDALWIFTDLANKYRSQASLPDELRCLALKSSALQNIGVTSEAERTDAMIAEICERMAGDLKSEDRIFHEVGRAQTLLQTGRFEELRRLTAQIKPRADAAGLTELGLIADMFAASSLFGLKQYEEAYRCFSQLLSRCADGGAGAQYLELHHGRLLHHAGKSLLKLGRRDDALDMHRRALRKERTWWTHEGLSRALATQSQPGQLAEALSSRMRAIEVAERESKGFAVSEFQLSWFEDKADIYTNLASQLLAMRMEDIPHAEHDVRNVGNSVEELALHFADRGKGRTLLQLMSGLSGAPGEGIAGLLTERRALADDISALIKRRGAAPRPGARHRFEKETEEIEAKLARQREIEAALRKAGRGVLIAPDPVKPLDFQRTLLPREACIEYAATENRLLIFMVTAKTIEAHTVDIERSAPQAAWRNGKLDTRKLAALYRTNTQAPATLGLEGLIQLQRDWMDNWQVSALSESEHIAVSQSLAHLLLPGGLRRALSSQNVKHLLIVPSHWLALTPFSTLVLDADGISEQLRFGDCRFVLHDYSVSFIQSLSVLSAVRQRQRAPSGNGGCQLLALGDPVHYDSDPRARDNAPVVLSQERLHAEAVRTRLLRSFDIIAAESGQEVWPRLKETRAETLSVAQTFKDHVILEDPISEVSRCPAEAVVCLGHAANRELALSPHLSRFSNILFSVHGHADLVNPWLSYLMLTDRNAMPGARQPAPLTMSDVFNMTLNADTVVLAACETALGPVRIGEGVIGFPLAFLFAGARSVLLTQWQIPSGYETAPDVPEIYPSTTVVTSFYSNWRKEGMSFGEALRQAQLQLYREADAFKDPFFWGAWQLYGEWLTGETQPLSSPRQIGLESARDVVASTPHPAADPERAARLNIKYIQDLKNWQALPWWKRFRTKKPERPMGI